MFYSEYTWLLWDAVACVLIFWCVRRCASRGLVRTVINFMSYFIAVFAARLLAPMAAEFLYEFVIRDALVLGVNNKIGEAIASGQDTALLFIAAFPTFLQKYLPPPSELTSGGWLEMDTVRLVDEIIEATVKSPVMLMVQSFCFIVVFSVSLFLIRRLSRVFTGLYRVPVIGPVNTFLGGVTGLLQAVIFLMIGGLAMKVLIALSREELEWLNSGIIDQTYIWRAFYSN